MENKKNDLETQFLEWIGEEGFPDPKTTSSSMTPVPIKVLMVRLALTNREEDERLTRSTEVSLKSFDRATLFRVLRQLERKKFIQLVDSKGKIASKEEIEAFYSPGAWDRVLGYVSLTKQGVIELQRGVR